MLDLIQKYGKNPYIFDDGDDWSHEIPPLELCNYLPLWDIRIFGPDDMRYNYGDLDFSDDGKFNYPDYNDIDYRESPFLVNVEGGDTNEQTHIDIDRLELEYGDPDNPLLVMDLEGGVVDEQAESVTDNRFYYQDMDELAAQPGDDKYEYQDMDEVARDDPGTPYYEYQSMDDIEEQDVDTGFYDYLEVDHDDDPSSIKDVDGGDEDEGGATYTQDLDFEQLSSVTEPTNPDAIDLDCGDEDEGGATYTDDLDFDWLAGQLEPTNPDAIDMDGGDEDEGGAVYTEDVDFEVLSTCWDDAEEGVIDVDGGDIDEQTEEADTLETLYPDEDDPSYVPPATLLDIDGGENGEGSETDPDYDMNILAIINYDDFYDSDHDMDEYAYIDFDQFYDSELDAEAFIYPDPIDPSEYTEEYDFDIISTVDEENPYEYLVRDVDGGDADEQLEHQNNHMFDYPDENDKWYVPTENLIDLEGGDTNLQTNEPDDGRLDFGDADELIDFDEEYYYYYQDVDFRGYIPPPNLVDVDGGDTDEQTNVNEDGRLDFGDLDEFLEYDDLHYAYDDMDDPFYVQDFELVDIDGGDLNEGVMEDTDEYDFNTLSYVDPEYTPPEALDVDGGDVDDPSIVMEDEYDCEELAKPREIDPSEYTEEIDFKHISVYTGTDVTIAFDIDGGDIDEEVGDQFDDLTYNYPDADEMVGVDSGKYNYPDMDERAGEEDDGRYDYLEVPEVDMDADDMVIPDYIVDVDGGDVDEIVTYDEDLDFEHMSMDEEAAPIVLDVDGGDADEGAVYDEDLDFDLLSEYTGADDPDTATDIEGGDEDEGGYSYDEDIDLNEMADIIYPEPVEDYDAEEYCKLLPIDPSEYTEDYDLNDMYYIEKPEDLYTEDLNFNTLAYIIPEEYANIYAVTAYFIARVLEDEVIKVTGDYLAKYEIHNMDYPEADAYLMVHIGINPRMRKVFVEFRENWRLRILMGEDVHRLGTVIAHRINNFFEMVHHHQMYHVEVIIPEDDRTFCCDTTYLLTDHTITYWKSLEGHYTFLEDREEVKIDLAKKGIGYDRREFYNKVHQLNVDYAMDETRHYMIPELFEKYKDLYFEEFGYHLPDFHEGYVQIAVKYDVLYRDNMYGMQFEDVGETPEGEGVA